MRPSQLRKLISKGETITVEFKGESKTPLPDRELVETVVCMANRAGNEQGWILIGVENDGVVTGARSHDNNPIDPLSVQALIANRTQPSLMCKVEMLAIENKPVLVIEVNPARVPIGTMDGKYLRRSLGAQGKPVCIPYYFHEIKMFQSDGGEFDYTQTVLAGATWETLDPKEFERYRRQINSNPGGDRTLLTLSDNELARALGVVDNAHDALEIKVSGLLFFGKEDAIRRFLPSHEIAFQMVKNNRLVLNEFYHWPLIRLLDEFFIMLKTTYQEEIVVEYCGEKIISVNCSDTALREALANAIAHRDYALLGAVHIQCHENRLEITNPGRFPTGVNLFNILATPPRPRNPALVDVLKRAGLVNRTALGISKIYLEQLRNGYSIPTYERSNETSTILTIPTGSPDPKMLFLSSRLVNCELELNELILVKYLLGKHSMRTSHISRRLRVSEFEAHAAINKLEQKGLIKQSNDGRVITPNLTLKDLSDS